MSAVPYEQLNLGGAVGDDPAAVRANRERAAASLGLDPARVVWMNQVHGARGRRRRRDRGATPPRPRASTRWSPPARTRPRGAHRGLRARCCSPTRSAGVVAAAHAGRPGHGRRGRAGRRRGDDRTRRRTRPDRRAAPDPPSAAGATRCRRRCAPRSPPSSRRRTPRRAGARPAVDVAAGVHAQLDAARGARPGAARGVHPGVGRPLLLPPRPHHRAARRICLAGLIGHDGPQGRNSPRTSAKVEERIAAACAAAGRERGGGDPDRGHQDLPGERRADPVRTRRAARRREPGPGRGAQGRRPARICRSAGTSWASCRPTRCVPWSVTLIMVQSVDRARLVTALSPRRPCGPGARWAASSRSPWTRGRASAGSAAGWPRAASRSWPTRSRRLRGCGSTD